MGTFYLAKFIFGIFGQLHPVFHPCVIVERSSVGLPGLTLQRSTMWLHTVEAPLDIPLTYRSPQGYKGHLLNRYDMQIHWKAHGVSNSYRPIWIHLLRYVHQRCPMDPTTYNGICRVQSCGLSLMERIACVLHFLSMQMWTQPNSKWKNLITNPRTR